MRPGLLVLNIQCHASVCPHSHTLHFLSKSSCPWDHPTHCSSSLDQAFAVAVKIQWKLHINLIHVHCMRVFVWHLIESVCQARCIYIRFICLFLMVVVMLFVPVNVWRCLLCCRGDAEIIGYALDTLHHVMSNEPLEEGIYDYQWQG